MRAPPGAWPTFPGRAGEASQLYRHAAAEYEAGFGAHSPLTLRAMVALAELLGLKREEVMAIGDQENDLAMLEYAGTGVAMGQAGASVIEAADEVTALPPPAVGGSASVSGAAQALLLGHAQLSARHDAAEDEGTADASAGKGRGGGAEGEGEGWGEG